ncbi:zinc finger protein 728-like [Octopus bimaculoides]|uniref:zinc finger protein 728-like n=1 Tax=Octopus bimaculoides TaxID=37653 RepID=UPI0022E97EB6|nr:zinc finger protein 728-like [Octopus bimaculoides]
MLMIAHSIQLQKLKRHRQVNKPEDLFATLPVMKEVKIDYINIKEEHQKNEKVKEQIFPEDKKKRTRKLSHDCDVCKKSFSQKGRLNKHKCVPTIEKPFYCGICGKSFSNQNDFNSHKCVHTRKKRFCCDICGKSFSASGSFEETNLRDAQLCRDAQIPVCSTLPLIV